MGPDIFSHYCTHIHSNNWNCRPNSKSFCCLLFFFLPSFHHSYAFCIHKNHNLFVQSANISLIFVMNSITKKTSILFLQLMSRGGQVTFVLIVLQIKTKYNPWLLGIDFLSKIFSSFWINVFFQKKLNYKLYFQ